MNEGLLCSSMTTKRAWSWRSDRIVSLPIVYLKTCAALVNTSRLCVVINVPMPERWLWTLGVGDILHELFP